MFAFKKATVSLYFLAGSLAALPASAALGFGPLGGANVANAKVEVRDTEAISGWAFGARLEMGVLPFLSLMLDPMLVQSGAKFDAVGNAVSGRGEFVFLEIPALLNLRLQWAQLGVYGFMGPNLVLTTDAGGSFTEPGDLEREDISTLGMGAQIGAGLAFGVAPSIDLTADARYAYGFTDVLEKAMDDIRNWRTRDVRLTLGVILHTLR